MKSLVAGAIAMLAIVLAAPVAHADGDKADMTVYEIRASNDAGKSDPELATGVLAKKLKKGPFRAWSKFEKLAKHKRSVQQLKADVTKLEPGGKLTVLYRQRMQSKGKKDRLRLSVTLDKKDGKRSLDTTVELDAGDYFLVGGQSLGKDATYILAITVK
jgi:hypothetical protein